LGFSLADRVWTCLLTESLMALVVAVVAAVAVAAAVWAWEVERPQMLACAERSPRRDAHQCSPH
jgi:hypothetical protein